VAIHHCQLSLHGEHVRAELYETSVAAGRQRIVVLARQYKRKERDRSASFLAQHCADGGRLSGGNDRDLGLDLDADDAGRAAQAQPLSWVARAGRGARAELGFACSAMSACSARPIAAVASVVRR
jgi:hypothetical protein